MDRSVDSIILPRSCRNITISFCAGPLLEVSLHSHRVKPMRTSRWFREQGNSVNPVSKVDVLGFKSAHGSPEPRSPSRFLLGPTSQKCHARRSFAPMRHILRVVPGVSHLGCILLPLFAVTRRNQTREAIRGILLVQG